MITKDGKEVKVIDDENEPSEDIIDEVTGKRKPKKKKIINEDGEVEDVEEIVEDIPTEYDEETGQKKPKKKKYKTKKGDSKADGRAVRARHKHKQHSEESAEDSGRADRDGEGNG